MRVFLSCRRDDTAGRAGRLFDGLSARLGERNVFHHVRSIAPGVEFHEAVVSALHDTDVTIVVIGADWLTLRGPDGVRRLDEPDDYVRLEVASALGAGGPVVPVLVGVASFPAAAELPDDLLPLLKRQAITIRDVAWHEDLDASLQRLANELSPSGSWWRKRAAVAALAALAVIGVGTALLVRNNDGSKWRALPACSPPDSSWSKLRVPDDATVTYEASDGTNRKLRYTSVGTWTTRRPPGWRVVADIEVSNESVPIEGTTADEWSSSTDDVERMVVNGFAGQTPACFNVATGTQQLPPGHRAIVRLGYDSAIDPSNAELLIEIDDGRPVPIAGIP